MLTPHKKGWASWSRSPLGSAPASVRSSLPTAGKEKGKRVLDGPPPPPQLSLGGGRAAAVDGAGDAEVWRSFREAGLLDEASLQKKERESLLERISELERELHDYQYNMGLLLIEKKEWTDRFEEIRQRFAETQEILKREQSAHLIVVSDLEKREENTKKALGIEKQCVVDLEKALREMRAEIAEVKFASDKKLADAHALEGSLEKKYIEVEHKMHSADAKLVEASRKKSEVDRVLEDIEARDRNIQRDYISLNTEKKAHEMDITQQREHFKEWEKSLQERQKRLVEEQSYLNAREERVNEMNNALEKKGDKLEDERKSMELCNRNIKEKDEDIFSRLQALSTKETEAASKQGILERKEKELKAIEQKLEVREKVEIQKVIDERRALLDSKTKDFESEMERRRQSCEDEVKNRSEAVEKKEMEIHRKLEQVSKREKEVQIKIDKLTEKEKGVDEKVRDSKEREKSLRIDAKQLDEERRQLDKDAEELAGSKVEFQRLKDELKSEKQQIIIESGRLEVTRDERDRYTRLQSELKDELEDCRSMKEAVSKHMEDLRLERDRFESEWQLLDNEKAALAAEVKENYDVRERSEKRRLSEEERVKEQMLNARAEIEKEWEKLNIEKESFQRLKLHEQSVALEFLRSESANNVQELESCKLELNIEMQKKQDEMEKHLQEKEDDFNKRRDLELNNLRATTSQNESLARKLSAQQVQLLREREEHLEDRKRLEVDQVEIQRDIDTLRELSRQLKAQREEFIKEKDHFRSMAEQCKVCRNCGVSIKELEFLGLQLTVGNDDDGDVTVPRFPDYLDERMKVRTPQLSGSASQPSGGPWSLLKKCSRLFNLSPGEKMESLDAGVGNPGSLGLLLDKESSEFEAADEPAQSFAAADESFNGQRTHSESLARDNEESRPNKDVDDVFPPDNAAGEIGGRILPSTGEHNEKEDSRPDTAVDSQPEAASTRRRKQPHRKARPKNIRRTRSVKQVVEDAKRILGEAAGEIDAANQKDGPSNSGIVKYANKTASSQAVDGMRISAARQKKRPADASFTTSELVAEDSDARSDSVSIGGGGRKRRQTSNSGMQQQESGSNRYYLRRPTAGVAAKAAKATAANSEGGLRTIPQRMPEEESMKSVVDGARTSVRDPTDVLSSQKQPGLEPAESQDFVLAESMEFSEHTRDDEANDDAATAVALETATAPRTPSGGGSCDDDDSGSDDDLGGDDGNSSIRDKLWTFFTT